MSEPYVTLNLDVCWYACESQPVTERVFILWQPCSLSHSVPVLFGSSLYVPFTERPQIKRPKSRNPEWIVCCNGEVFTDRLYCRWCPWWSAWSWSLAERREPTCSWRSRRCASEPGRSLSISTRNDIRRVSTRMCQLWQAVVSNSTD